MIKRRFLILVISVFVLHSCASKKDVLYFQDANEFSINKVIYDVSKIQPNDILNITIGALVPETALPYNAQTTSVDARISLDLLQLHGYLVSTAGTIKLPILGTLQVSNKTTSFIEKEIKSILEKDDHLIKPTVNVRLLNAKVTVLGEVKIPGTFTFTEQNITLPQALGYAGDLTINGLRDDILLIREENGIRTIHHIDLTSAAWFNNPTYHIKPNDVIVVNPNNARVKNAGFIGNAGTVVTIASLILTSVVLITN